MRYVNDRDIRCSDTQKNVSSRLVVMATKRVAAIVTTHNNSPARIQLWTCQSAGFFNKHEFKVRNNLKKYSIIFWTANDVTRRIVVFLRNTLRQVARWSSKESWETPDRRAPGAERFLGISRQPMKRQAAIAHTVWHTQSNALPEPCQAWLQTG